MNVWVVEQDCYEPWVVGVFTDIQDVITAFPPSYDGRSIPGRERPGGWQEEPRSQGKSWWNGLDMSRRVQATLVSVQ